MPGHDIIVIGASAGGVEALMTITKQLPADLPAAVFVVLHIPAQSPSLLPVILNRAGPLEALHPGDGTTIEHGHIYVAPPDHHLLIEYGKMRVLRGPKENRHRPAIDPLFRSAARAYGSRVIGVILTGSLDDGTAGLLAIKRAGGLAVVQDPNDALYPSMPMSALTYVEVDYTLPLEDISSLLERLASEPAKEEEVDYSVSEEMEKETRLVEMDTALMQSNEHVGTPSVFSCPQCGGVLWELHDDELVRFRCRVGHAFSAESMLAEQNETLEEALWVALKAIEESVELSKRMAQQAEQRGQKWLVRQLEERYRDGVQRATLIKQALMKSEPAVGPEANNGPTATRSQKRKQS